MPEHKPEFETQVKTQVKTLGAVDIYRDALEAERRIRSHVVETPLEFSRYFSRLGDCRVYLKLENTQRSGSFKFRGAANMMLALSPDNGGGPGPVTSSTGNHGAAFAEMLELLDRRGTIYLPKNAAAAKVEALRQYKGVELVFHGEDTVEAEVFARGRAAREGRVFVPPYNHRLIIGGQGTTAIELTRRLPDPDTVLLPVGGGGLAAGVAGYLKGGGMKADTGVEIIGCQPLHSPVMVESVRAGRIVAMESLPTLADGTAGGIEPGSITFGPCRDLLDDFILVSEQDIARALQEVLRHHCLLIEGAAALPVAGFIKNIRRFRHKTVVLVLTGRKITLERLKQVLYN